MSTSNKQTIGERIAAEHAHTHHERDCAAAIDKAVAEAREEGCAEMETELDAQCSRAHVAEQAAQNIAGDNLCWITDPEKAKALPEAEFMESCRRYRQQITDERGEFTGGRTIAQLEQALAAKEADAGAMQQALFQLGEQAATTVVLRLALQAEVDQYHLDSDGGYIQHEDGLFECVVCGSPDGPSRGRTREQVVHVPDCRQAVHDRSEAALASNAGEALLARLLAAEEKAARAVDALKPFADLAQYFVGRPETLRGSSETAMWKLEHGDIIAASEAFAAIQAARGKEPG